MKRPLKRLAPSAKKLFLTVAGDYVVSTLVQLAPSIDRQAFEIQLRQHEGTLRSWMPEMGVAAVDINAARLPELAEFDGVVYVEANQAYQP